MDAIAGNRLGGRLARAGASALALTLTLAACDDEPLDPGPDADAEALLELTDATDAYHDVDAAIADGFVLAEACEEVPGEGTAGTVYVHLDRLGDTILDPSLPEALLYEPQVSGPPELVGVEMAIPSSLWTADEPPEFLGEPLQLEGEAEEEVFGLHIWIWRDNPDGLFAPAHPNVSCDA